MGHVRKQSQSAVLPTNQGGPTSLGRRAGPLAGADRRDSPRHGDGPMSLLRLWRVLRRRRDDVAILREELSAHLQALEEHYRAEGLAAEAARTGARRQFGNVTNV